MGKTKKSDKKRYVIVDDAKGVYLGTNPGGQPMWSNAAVGFYSAPTFKRKKCENKVTELQNGRPVECVADTVDPDTGKQNRASRAALVNRGLASDA